MVAKKVGLIVLILLVFSLFFAIAAPVRASDEELIGVDCSANLSTTGIDFSFPDSLPPVAQLNKTYGESDNDHAYSIVQTNDGGYALAGDTWHGDVQSDFWLVKTDSYGNMQWNKSYGESTEEVANSVIQVSDGGYVLAGWYYSDTHGRQLRVIKTDSSGDGEWMQTLGEYGFDEANCVVQTSDGGIAVAGATSQYGYYSGGYYSDFWLVKLDLFGNIEWNRTYGYAAPANDVAYSLAQTDDGGYILAGQDGVDYDFWLVKTDSNGDMEWNRTIEHPYGSSTPHSIIQTFDGGYAVVGECHTIYGDTNIWLVKTDDFGEVEWTREDGTDYYDNAYSVVQTSDEGYAIAGYSGYSRFLLLRIDGTGEAIYSEEYGPELSYCYAFSMVQTSDGGYAMAGCLESEYTGFDFYLVKTEPELSQHDIAITDVWASKSIASQGHSLSIVITAENQGDYAENFNLSVYANSTIVDTQIVTLEEKSFATIPLTWNTTGFARGNYIISAYAPPVTGEEEISDNTYTFGGITVTIEGDVDGDFDVDILDVVRVTAVYASELGDPSFNPNSDLNGDNQITILDVVICTSNYGQKWP